MYQTLQTGQLVDRDGAPGGCELVVTAAFAVISFDPIRGLLDEPVLNEAIQGAVQRSRTHANRAVTQLSDPPHEPVAVELPIEQSQNDVQ
jgi:hypothetical protein